MPGDRKAQASSAVDSIDYHDSTISAKVNPDVKSQAEQPVQKFFYPNMSHCGGALYGIYKNGQLIRIESTYGAELGYSSKNVDFVNGEIVKITYREYFAEWDRYYEQYPHHQEPDPEKMTYSDTLYVLEFGNERSFRKYAGETLISTTVNQELTDRLLQCVETMKSELASEKQLVKE